MFPARQPRRAAPCELRESCPSLAAYISGNHRCSSSTECRESRRESQAVREEPEGPVVESEGLAVESVVEPVRRLSLQVRAQVSRTREMRLLPQLAARLPRHLLRRGYSLPEETPLQPQAMARAWLRGAAEAERPVSPLARVRFSPRKY